VSETWSVAVAGESTSALVERAADDAPVFVFAHGAGGHMADRSMQQASRTLLECGLTLVRFNFLYREKRQGRPDPMPHLIACTAAVIERVRAELQPRTLIIGGRSMGGRTASMMAAQAYPCDGLLLLAYPLHPDGKPQQLRDAHLPDIKVPVLCFNGTRDSMCTPEIMREVLTRVGDNWRMHWLDGADHSFHVLKSSGRTDADVQREVGDATAAWLAALRRTAA
jgi:uncharacterized protein